MSAAIRVRAGFLPRIAAAVCIVLLVRTALPAAATAAKDGDTIDIDAGEYRGDVAVWTATRLTIRGVGGMAHLEAAGKSAQQ